MNGNKSIRRITVWMLMCVWLLCTVLPVRAAGQVYNSESQAAAVLRQALVERQTEVTITYTIARENLREEWIMDLLMRLYQKAIAHTGVGNEGDYLYFHGQGYSYGYGYEDDGTGSTVEVNLQYGFSYYTNAAQETELTTKVNQVLAGLNLTGKTDYEKVKAIYDYICKNITYDRVNLNNEEYTLKYSAYAALVNKTAVCQGYANLFYRLANAAGLDARIISGQSMNLGHAWNIVKIDGKYYYVDSTWDAGRTKYSYFLKGSRDFADHAPYLNHPTDGVTYPVSSTNYVIPVPETTTEAPTTTEEATETPTTTERPTERPTEEVTEAPTTAERPTTIERPTEEPTEEATETPTTTERPTEEPTEDATETLTTTERPTEEPTEDATETPTTTERPTEEPTEDATETPTTTGHPTEDTTEEEQSPTTEEMATEEPTEEETEEEIETETQEFIESIESEVDETVEVIEGDSQNDLQQGILLAIGITMVAGTALVVSAVVIKKKQR